MKKVQKQREVNSLKAPRKSDANFSLLLPVLTRFGAVR
jgi:hypothetical protein